MRPMVHIAIMKNIPPQDPNFSKASHKDALCQVWLKNPYSSEEDDF